MLVLLLGVQPISLMLTKALCQEGHDVCVISEDSEKLAWLQQKIDCKTIVGRPSHPHVLRQADAARADMLIAATQNDEMNMVACQVGYSLFQIPKKIAFISSAHYLVRHELFGDDNLPIDVFINIEQSIAQQLAQILRYPACRAFKDIPHMPFCLLTTTITSQGSLCQQPLQALQEKMAWCQILSVQHHHQPMVLHANSRLHAGDEVVLVCHQDHIQDVLTQCHGPMTRHTHIAISAAPGILACFAQLSRDDGFHIKVMEEDLSLCHDLAPKHPNYTILHGHLTDHDFLQEEQMGHADVFCALSQDDEDNIMASLQAKDLGAQHAIAMITEHHYRRMMMHTPIDCLLNPNHEVVGRILAHCHHPWIKDIMLLPNSTAVVIRVKPDTQHAVTFWQAFDAPWVLQRDQQLCNTDTVTTIETTDQILMLLPNAKAIQPLCHAMENIQTTYMHDV